MIRIFHHPWTEFINLSPSLYECKCLQCDMLYTAIIYNNSKGQVLTLLPNSDGGITTPHTPNSVSYYLDQAYKSHIIGANSAAAAMYRAALEQILYDQNYKQRMLGPKIDALENDINNKNMPDWALQLSTDFMRLQSLLLFINIVYKRNVKTY